MLEGQVGCAVLCWRLGRGQAYTWGTWVPRRTLESHGIRLRLPTPFYRQCFQNLASLLCPRIPDTQPTASSV